MPTPSVARPSAAGAVAQLRHADVRRASTTPSVGTTGRLRICSTRTFACLVTDSSGCTGAPNGQINDLVVNAYYVDRDSTHRAGAPLAAPQAVRQRRGGS